MKSSNVYMAFAFIATLGSGFLKAPPVQARPAFAAVEFANRAQCAVASRLPARSVLIVGDSYDAGRLGFNLSRLAGPNGQAANADVMSKFRQSVGYTFSLVAGHLVSGRLPMLSDELKGLVAQCESNRKCAPLENKIAQNWAKLPQLHTSIPRTHITCLKLDRFSALQGHLGKTRPDVATLTDIGQTLSSGKGLTSCDSDTASNDRHFLLQLDLPQVAADFDKTGFDFWASMKAYVSWAWRYAPEIRYASGRYADLFPQMALEDELIMVPNGCRSITYPKCDLQRLAIDSIRELAKPPTAESGFEKQFTDGPQNLLLSRGARGVNDGFLGTSDADAGDWVKNFSQRFNEARWVSRNKLQNVTRVANLMHKLGEGRTDKASTLIADLKADIARFSPKSQSDFKAQLAAICVETRILTDEKFKLLRPQFDAVSAAGGAIGLDVNEQRAQAAALPRIFNAVKKVGEEIIPVCESLEKEVFAKSENSYAYLSDWAIERMNGLIHDKPLSNEQRTRGWNRPETYLTLSTGKVEICRSPAACVQLLFKSYVDLHYVSTWAAALGRTHKLKDSNLFNPYAELNACKVYDPWFAKSEANSMLAQRLVTSALNLVVPLPVLAEFASNRPRVQNLSAKVTDGNVQFDAEFADDSTRKTFFADLGPLVGAPCAVQYSNDTGVPFQVYGLGGVTLNFCSDSKGNESEATDASNIKHTPIRRSVCGGCTINVASAASVASYAAPAGPLRAVFGSARAFSLYLEAQRDNVNIPISYTVRPDYVRDTYVEFGKTIPPHCEQSLINGFRCYEDVCAANAAHELEQRTGLRAKESSIGYDGGESGASMTNSNTGIVGIRVAECDGEINARVRCDTNNRQYELNGEFSSFSRSCTAALKNRPKGLRK